MPLQKVWHNLQILMTTTLHIYDTCVCIFEHACRNPISLHRHSLFSYVLDLRFVCACHARACVGADHLQHAVQQAEVAVIAQSVNACLVVLFSASSNSSAPGFCPGMDYWKGRAPACLIIAGSGSSVLIVHFQRLSRTHPATTCHIGDDVLFQLPSAGEN